jgi:hypothetical protein
MLDVRSLVLDRPRPECYPPHRESDAAMLTKKWTLKVGDVKIAFQ